MNEDQPDGQFGGPLATALRTETESWTPACLPPEQVIELAERSVPEAEAMRLMAHVALCARCRREYAETAELLQLSSEVRALEEKSAGATPTVAPAPARAPAEPAPPAMADRERRRPFWQEWFRPVGARAGALQGSGGGLALGAAAAALVVYLTSAAPAQHQRDRLASALTEREAMRARLEQELAELKRQNAGESTRLAEEARQLAARLKAQGVRMARLERDAAVLGGMPLPTPAWLLPASGTVRGSGNGGGDSPEILLIRPVDTAVQDSTPTLEFRPVAGATQYAVSLELEGATEEVPAPRRLAPTRWQVTRPLRRGRVYQWAVTAQGREGPLRSRLVRFYILGNADTEAIERARKEHAGNPLALGTLYARLGLKAEAEQQFRAALKADPEQSVARRWLAELARRRQEGSNR